jgi:hypothetical protein
MPLCNENSKFNFCAEIRSPFFFEKFNFSSQLPIYFLALSCPLDRIPPQISNYLLYKHEGKKEKLKSEEKYFHAFLNIFVHFNTLSRHFSCRIICPFAWFNIILQMTAPIDSTNELPGAAPNGSLVQSFTLHGNSFHFHGLEKRATLFSEN